MAEQYLYQTICGELRDAVFAGRYVPGNLIPSENELAAKYATSRVTVRKALRILEGEGLLKPLHGKGYLVLSPEFTRFKLDFSDTPAGGSAKYLSIDVIPADGELARRLGIEWGRMLVVTRRLLRAEGAPDAYDEKYVPYQKGDPIIERELHYAQFPDMFTDRYVPRTIWTEMEIDAAPAPAEISTALGREGGAVLLRVSRTIFTGEGTRIGFGRRWLAGGMLTAVSDYEAERL